MSWADALFRPRQVVVVGSVSAGKIGRVLVEQLLEGGFSRVATVNPHARGIHGLPSADSFRTLAEQGICADLAVIASPASTVADVLDDAGSAGVRAAVIITAGFSEIGHVQEEAHVVETARRHGIRWVGPNCAGLVNTKHHLYPTLETRPPTGDVAFLSQSGALGGAVLSWAEEQGLGFSKFVSYGNAADLAESDFLEVLREDEETRVVAMYVEAVSDGRRFLDAAARLCAVKPLIVIKAGRSTSGVRATRSHTGSLAGEDAVYDAALRQCGAVRVSGIEEMFDLCRGFVHLPAPRGRRLAIVTNSGGPAVLAADAAEATGLDVAPPRPPLPQTLRELLSPVCSLSNPFDLTVQGTEEQYRETLIAALTDYDAALALNVNTPYLDAAPLARGVVAAANRCGKPVVSSFMAGSPAQAALPVLLAGGVPNFSTGERAVRVLASTARYAEMAQRLRTETKPLTMREPSRATLERLPWTQPPTEPQALDWLESMGYSTIERRLATSAEEAVRAFQQFDRPVAVKLVSPSVSHKSDVGGVALSLSTEAAVAAAFDRMQSLVTQDRFGGVLVTPMIEEPVEALIGLSHDAQFGPVIAVGIGGIYTELLKDVSLRVAPISAEEAERMIDELKGKEVLRGTRGRSRRDVAALAKLASEISLLPSRISGIEEMDLNPVFLLTSGCVIGDVRIIPTLSSSTAKEVVNP